MITGVGILSHLLACTGFAGLAVYVLWKRQQSAESLWLGLACLMTALWAGILVFGGRFGGGIAVLVSPAETLRTAAWILALAMLLSPTWHLRQRVNSSFVIAVALGVVLAVQVAIDLIVGVGGFAEPDSPLIVQLSLMARLTTAIGGLVLVHNLYLNSAPASRWSIQLLCIGLAVLFAYDLNMYTLAFLGAGQSFDLFNARGLITVLTLPLIALSARRNPLLKIQISRQIAFQTLSLGIIGGYLVLMSIAAYGLGLVSGDWGRLFQISVPVAMGIFAAVVLFSGRFRASARVWINKNFFAYKYDYREEWLRLISTVSRTDAAYGSLAERVVQSVCNIVESPGGALYVPDGEGGFGLAERWNYRALTAQSIEGQEALTQFLGERGRVILVDELRDGIGDYGGVVLPSELLADPDAWLIVPLLHLESLAGLVLVQRSKAASVFNWEDFDLLRTAGRQAASYIAEAASQSALSEAQKFDEFNRRFAFIMHDIKNLVSQLSLVARNAERHAESAEFRRDMVATLRSSVDKMNDMLARLAQHNTARGDETNVIDLTGIVGTVVAEKRTLHPALNLEMPAEPVHVRADPHRIEQVFVHLLQNAIDASAPDMAIEVRLTVAKDQVRIDVIDSGSGMSAAFVRDDLFKPFRSTKTGGFGIGAYEAREIVRASGGRLDVASREGEGTIFSVILPLAAGTAKETQA